jgi:glycosyltransferase involved in cell wall biosynthesis
MNVLWLASWYPNKNSFLDGDFIERHAKVASLYDNIFVIHVVKSPFVNRLKIEKEEKKYSETLNALIYYYPSYKSFGRVIDLILSNFFFVFLHFKAYRQYVHKYGRPKGILVQTGMKAGIIAVLFRKLYNIPYLLFERWAGLLKEASPNFYDWSKPKQWLWRKVLKHSFRLITVSEYFADSINRLYYKKSYTVIPNAVDSQLFYPVQRASVSYERFRFIHISTLNWQKNFEDILRALRIVINSHPACVLEVYGPENEGINQLTIELGLQDAVMYKGEKAHSEIAKALQRSHALILYSRFESFGNVIIEANACGLPVIVSDFPVFREIVQEQITGITVRGESPDDLAEKMIWMIQHYDSFDSQNIAELTKEKYNNEKIGRMFHDLFSESFNI